MQRDDANLRWIGLAIGVLLAGFTTLGCIFVLIPAIGWQLGRADPDFFKIGLMVGAPVGLYAISASCVFRPATVLAPFFESDEDKDTKH